VDVGRVIVSPFDHQAIEAINYSTLKEMRVSPLHYRHSVDNPREDTARFGIGRAVHTAILQPDRLSIDYAVFDGARRAGKAWDAFEAEHDGKTILKRDEWALVQAITKRVGADPIAREWLSLDKALIERPITWTDAATGLQCKGRPDVVHSAIVDVKSTSTIDERAFRAQAARLGYFGQLAFYRRGYRTLTKLSLPCAIVAVELEAPHDVGVFVVDEDSLRVADEEISRLLAKVSECRKTGKWPGRYQAVQTLTLPDWARGGENDFNFWEAA
jgi:hypothetical protein